jgi:oligoendopeptidase F
MTEARIGVVWDLTTFFPEFKGPAMIEFRETLESDLKALTEEASRLDVLTNDTADEWEQLVLATEDLRARTSHLYSYVGCLSAAHAGNDEYAREEASLGLLGAKLDKLRVEVLRALKDVPDDVFEAFVEREELTPVAYSIRRSRQEAAHTMSPDEERLAADLGVDGIHAWGRLYDKITGTLEWDMVHPNGKRERLPISQWRALMSDVDRETGRAAFEGGNRSWAQIEDVCAACLNAISGTRLTLNERREHEHYLAPALFQARLSRATLDSMYEAIEENIETAREIFRVKANAMGRNGIWFWERESPLPAGPSDGESLISWEQGVEMVGNSFDGAYPALGEYFQSMLEKRWIESEARGGKRPGAFCTGSYQSGEQRVYMTFNGTLGDTRTLAHEVGHAWHSHVMKDMRVPARSYPMTLAETASTFGEQILAEGILESNDVSDATKLAMLDTELSSAAVMLLDITVRFRFEQKFHDERKAGELSAARLRELMVETQREVFGDVLVPYGEDPLFWVSKLHFYISGVTFYNFPYTFGFLLTRALYARYREEGAAFLPKYEEFLRLTGSDDVEGVIGNSIGGDTTTADFWQASIRSLEEPIADYRSLLAHTTPGG